jgi:hypothetical protein
VAPNDVTPADGRPPDGVIDPDAPPIDVPPNNARQKTITVESNRVTGTHTGFPVWVLLPTDTELAARAQPNGSDIHFTLAGQPVPYEIQRWDKSTGHLEAWVRLDISSAVDTVFEVRYGDPALAHAQDSAAVFGAEYFAVWHLEDNTTIADARGAIAGTPVNTPGLDNGKLGRGVTFDGVAEEITFANPYTGNVAHTISAWVMVAAPKNTGFSSMITMGNPTGNQSRFFHTHYNTGVGWGMFQNDHLNSTNLDNDGYTLVHWVYAPSGNGGTSTLFVDGGQVTTEVHEATVNTQGAEGHLATAPGGWGPGGVTNPMFGNLDEVRLATVARSANYITTEFANQNRPDQFLTVAATETELP